MRRITRRSLLGAVVGPVLAGTRSAAEQIQTGSWTDRAVQDFSGGVLDGLQVVGDDPAWLIRSQGRTTGSYLSPVRRASFRFNAVGLRWTSEVPEGARVALELRASDDGLTWTGWIALVASAHGRDGMPTPGQDTGPVGRQTSQVSPLGEARSSELVFLNGSLLQYRVTLTGQPGARPPRLGLVTTTYLDSTRGPTASEAAGAAEAGPIAQAVGKPPIISRAAWNCPEPNSSKNWPPEYRPVVKLFVHHSTGSDGGSDPAAMVRAIWHYHTYVINNGGWGDIGYNYLVDKSGNIYEGRYGGDNVVAGHALCYNWGSAGIALIGSYGNESNSVDVPEAMQKALVRLLAWKCDQQKIDPTGSGYFIDQTLPNLLGHRDGRGGCNNASGLYTFCPGDFAYARLAAIRQQTRDALFQGTPDYAVGWPAHATPGQMSPRQTVTTSVTVQNLGRLTWSPAMPYPFRLGYRWYRSDGSQVALPPEDDKRTSLPGTIAYGQQVALQAQLTAPSAPGTYTLKWDMVHELVTWFSARGSPTLNVNVTVPSPVLITSVAALSFLAQAGTTSDLLGLAWNYVYPGFGSAGPFSWTATVVSGSGWLFLWDDSQKRWVSQVSGQSPEAVPDGTIGRLVRADATGLTPGSYDGSIRVTVVGTSISATVTAKAVVAQQLRRMYFPLLGRGHRGGW